MLRSYASRFLAFTGIVALVAVGNSCNLDPVHKNNVKALGEEKPDDYPPESEFHRPGEPCALCHSTRGPADSEFVLAGTVFWGPDNYSRRVDKAYVRIVDGIKARRCFVTNCNGNFFVTRADFPEITFPILVSVERTVDPGTKEDPLTIRRMASHIGREPSCATCHIQGLRDYGSPGQIHLYNTENEAKEKSNGKIVECPPDEDYKPVLKCPEDVEQ
ncbi:MAG: hypothetical protein U0270_13975 [Labilithrix sp.]